MRSKLLTVFFGAMGLANVARALLAFRIGPAFESYALSFPLPILGGLYLLWGIGFLVFAALFWTKRALRWSLLPAALYQLTVWALRLFAYRSEYARNLWMINIALTAGFLLVVFVLSLNRNSVSSQ